MKYLLRSFVFALIGLLFVLSCSSSTNSDDDEEFVATLDDFAGYISWTLIASETSPDPFLGAAHGVNDNFTRNIYFKNDAVASNGKYEKGTLIVKELRDGDWFILYFNVFKSSKISV